MSHKWGICHSPLATPHLWFGTSKILIHESQLTSGDPSILSHEWQIACGKFAISDSWLVMSYLIVCPKWQINDSAVRDTNRVPHVPSHDWCHLMVFIHYCNSNTKRISNIKNKYVVNIIAVLLENLSTRAILPNLIQIPHHNAINKQDGPCIFLVSLKAGAVFVQLTTSRTNAWCLRAPMIGLDMAA